MNFPMEFLTTIVGGIIWVFMYLFVVYIHEIGHWLVMRWFGFKDITLKPNIAQDLEIGRNIHHKITLMQTLFVSIGGILAGVLPLMLIKFVVSKEVMLMTVFIYMYGCSGDLNTINMIVTSKLNLMKNTLYDLNKFTWANYKKETEKYIKAEKNENRRSRK